MSMDTLVLGVVAVVAPIIWIGATRQFLNPFNEKIVTEEQVAAFYPTKRLGLFHRLFAYQSEITAMQRFKAALYILCFCTPPLLPWLNIGKPFSVAIAIAMVIVAVSILIAEICLVRSLHYAVRTKAMCDLYFKNENAHDEIIKIAEAGWQ